MSITWIPLSEAYRKAAELCSSGTSETIKEDRGDTSSRESVKEEEDDVLVSVKNLYQGESWGVAEEANEECCALLRLPPELRNRIYYELIPRGSDFVLPLRSSFYFYTFDEELGYIENRPLFQICRRVRTEAERIYWGSNTFTFKRISWGVEGSQRALRAVDVLSETAVASLRNVKIEVSFKVECHCLTIIHEVYTLSIDCPNAQATLERHWHYDFEGKEDDSPSETVKLDPAECDEEWMVNLGRWIRDFEDVSSEAKPKKLSKPVLKSLLEWMFLETLHRDGAIIVRG